MLKVRLMGTKKYYRAYVEVKKRAVGKTTTTSNLGIGLAKQGKKVLLIDADAQGSLTAGLGAGLSGGRKNCGNKFTKNSVFKRYCPMYNKSGERR